MTYAWDEDKAASNLHKNGIPFDYATGIFQTSSEWNDRTLTQHDEDRWIVISLVEEDELTVVTTERGDKVRLISAGKATSHERIEYWENRWIHFRPCQPAASYSPNRNNACAR